jgi:hypothetical protein
MYDHVSPFGTFSIKPDQCAHQGWCLWLDDELLGPYPTPQDAALAVHNHLTGHAEWDAWYAGDIPADLRDWTSGYWAAGASHNRPEGSAGMASRRHR